MTSTPINTPCVIVNEDLQALPAGLVDAHCEFHRVLHAGPVEAILAFYESDAQLVVQPGQVVCGHAAIRRALEDFQVTGLEIRPRRVTFIATGSVALVIGAWSARAFEQEGEPVVMEGTAVDVMRCQSDGRWLYAVDDPWGTGVLQDGAA